MRSSIVGSIQLGVGGAVFALYPMLRGFGPEGGRQAAALYARPEWLLAHVLGMAGFALLAVGLAGVDLRASRWATWGVFAVLPYYGAEAFGLHALGLRILQTGHEDMVDAATMFRYQPIAITMFALGLAVLAAVGVRLVVLGVRSSGALRWGLVLTGVALVAYLPQFFLPGPARIAHGLLLGAGLVLVAASSHGPSATPTPSLSPVETR